MDEKLAYVCFDTRAENKYSGFIWFHDRAPKNDIELWAVIDEWTRIGIAG